MTELEQEYNYTPLSKPLRITEQSWPEGTVPLVSIRCITYNHVNFIRDAIEGFLMQETTFPVEILIHDDASTDGTDEIIQEYEKKYPSLISAYYQPENTYQHPNRMELRRPFSEAIRGKYIAVCEGDDYWIDPEKLRIQVDGLELNVNCALSFTPAYRLNSDTGKVLDIMGEIFGKDNRIVSLEEVVGNGLSSIATCAVVINKKKIYEGMYREFFKQRRTSFFIKFVGSINGAVFTPLVMSCYRANVPGSHTERTRNDSRLKLRYFREVNNGFLELSNHLSDNHKVMVYSAIRKRSIILMGDPGLTLREKKEALEYMNYFLFSDIFLCAYSFLKGVLRRTMKTWA